MDDATPYHITVLGAEVCTLLAPHPGGRYLDMTLGGGGHSALLLEQGDTHVLGVDRDPAAIATARARLASHGTRFETLHAPFDEVTDAIGARGLGPFDGIVMDLGVSSHQLNTPDRGFSFASDGPLDMRMDPTSPLTAADLIADDSTSDLSYIFRAYGEERHARRIARAIVAAREIAPITTTGQLAQIVSDAAPAPRGPRRIHPATRVFMALRIAVNDELARLERGLDIAFELLAPGGRLAVISFHSLEDRPVKHRFRDWCRGCICPPRIAICVCDHKAQATALTRRALRPGDEEVATNPRARSARLRAIARLAPLTDTLSNNNSEAAA